MSKLKVEWVNSCALHENQTDTSEDKVIPVVRLDAVDQVLAEAVWAMEIVRSWSITYAMDINHASRVEHPEVQATLRDDEGYQRAQAFLASPLVTDWRARQKHEGQHGT